MQIWSLDPYDRWKVVARLIHTCSRDSMTNVLAMRGNVIKSNSIGIALALRKKVEVNPTTKISRAIEDDKGVSIIETNHM